MRVRREMHVNAHCNHVSEKSASMVRSGVRTHPLCVLPVPGGLPGESISYSYINIL